METTLEQVDQRQEVSSPTVTFAILEEEEDDEDEEKKIGATTHSLLHSPWQYLIIHRHGLNRG